VRTTKIEKEKARRRKATLGRGLVGSIPKGTGVGGESTRKKVDRKPTGGIEERRGGTKYT